MPADRLLRVRLGRGRVELAHIKARIDRKLRDLTFAKDGALPRAIVSPCPDFDGTLPVRDEHVLP